MEVEDDYAAGDQHTETPLRPSQVRVASPPLRELIREELRAAMASRTVRDRASDSVGEAQHDAPANQDLGAAASRWPTRQDKEDLSVKIKAFDPKEMEWGAFRAYFLALSNQAN